MKKTRPIISFEKSFLQNLVNDESSCVTLQQQDYHLALHPYHLTNINSSIKDLLGQGIARYDKKLNGILLGYENIKLLTEGSIVDDSFFVHIDVSANFYIFKPEVGKVLVSVVNKKSVDHIGCLVYETFNVSIPKPEGEDITDWIGNTVDIGDEVSFRITVLKLETRLPYIKGELVKVINKIERHNATEIVDDEIMEDDAPKKKKSKKKKSKEESIGEVTEESSPRKHENSVDTVKHKKSKRKSKDIDCEPSLSKKRLREELENEIDFNSTKKKKKKSHHEKLNLDNSSEMQEDDLNTSLSHKKKKKLVNGDADNYEHTHKKKKKKNRDNVMEESIEEVTVSFENSKPRKDNDTFDDDSPKKKKRKNRDNVMEESIEGVTVSFENSKSRKDNDTFDDDSPKEKKRKNRDNVMEESIEGVTVSFDNSTSRKHNDTYDDDSPKKKKKKRKDKSF